MTRLAVVLYAGFCLHGCCATFEKTTAEQQKKTQDTIWGGDAEAHKKRVP